MEPLTAVPIKHRRYVWCSLSLSLSRPLSLFCTLVSLALPTSRSRSLPPSAFIRQSALFYVILLSSFGYYRNPGGAKAAGKRKLVARMQRERYLIFNWSEERLRDTQPYRLHVWRQVLVFCSPACWASLLLPQRGEGPFNDAPLPSIISPRKDLASPPTPTTTAPPPPTQQPTWRRCPSFSPKMPLKASAVCGC